MKYGSASYIQNGSRSHVGTSTSSSGFPSSPESTTGSVDYVLKQGQTTVGWLYHGGTTSGTGWKITWWKTTPTTPFNFTSDASTNLTCEPGSAGFSGMQYKRVDSAE